ncbi:hypothetical protein PSEUDO8AS_50070 [Pseudomonas sp. 8AS]|nr:hypothetical protein PSEUDO8AS_50070 [Pseudomonas sp. 8AS]
MLPDVPLLEGRAVHHRAAGGGVGAVQRADGHAGHRSQGGDPAGGGPGGRGGGRLRHLPVRAGQAPDRARGPGPAHGVLRGHAPARHGGDIHRGDHVDRGGHLGILAAEVPGRHGHPAGLHVPGECVRRRAAAAGPGLLAERGWRAPREQAAHRTAIRLSAARAAHGGQPSAFPITPSPRQYEAQRGISCAQKVLLLKRKALDLPSPN